MPFTHHIPPFGQALDGFRKGTLTPRAYLEQVIDAANVAEDPFQAFSSLDLAHARGQADAATGRYARQAPLSALDGMPMGIKDIMETSWLPTAMGSAIYRDWRPRANAAAVDALVEGGAVLLGKTHTTEFAIGRAAPTRNPHDPGRTPGGSSSGTAAAVAAGMISAGLGTQTQGSIVRPAGYCGVVGYKPTWGVLPTHGVHPVSRSHDHLGIIAQSVDLVWAVARHITEWMPGGARAALPRSLPALDADQAPLRSVAVLRTAGYDELSGAEQDAFEAGCASLSAGGIRTTWPREDGALADFCALLDAVPDASAEMVARDMRWPYAHYCRQHPESVSQKIHDMVERGRQVSTQRYQSLLERRDALLARLRDLAGRYDAFILPSSSGVAPVGLDNTGSRTLGVYGSYLGIPAVSLPAMRVGHMPLGLQLLGLPLDDHALLCRAKRMSELLGPACPGPAHPMA